MRMCCFCRVCPRLCMCVAVLLAVVVSITVFGITPMAQLAMDKTVLTLDNATLKMAGINSSTGALFTDMTIVLPGLFNSHIHSFRTTLKTNGQEFGHFQFPEVAAKVGMNHMKFHVPFTITDTKVITNFSTFLLLFTNTDLEILGEPHVTMAMFTATPKQDKRLFCNALLHAASPDFEQAFSDGISLSMVCTPEPSPAALGLVATSTAPKKWRVPGCHKMACRAKCECAEQHCAAEVSACSSDESCSVAEDCANQCQCGDKHCLAACTSERPSAVEVATTQCLRAHCPSLVLTSLSKVGDLPACNKTACVSKCQCGERHCATEIEACLADATCSSSQACVEACPCGSNVCLAKCAVAYPSAAGLSVLTCLTRNCPAEHTFYA